MNDDLFSKQKHAGYQPLADRVRPKKLEEYFGQKHIVGEGKALKTMLDSQTFQSIIFWGPPGVGKTTLALLVSEYLNAHFISLSAVLAGVKDIRQAIEEAKHKKQQNIDTVLFIDEVHRFNKSQQDAFLPHVEKGTVIFIGASTENPSFELNNALLSRARVFVLNTLTEKEIVEILDNALAYDESVHVYQPLFPASVLEKIAQYADGDARRALNTLELACELLSAALENTPDFKIDEQFLNELLSGQQRRFDKGGDIFYEQISALHKSVRGSSPDAALYWFYRMLDGGCDPRYLARRILRMASEDIGNADPRALTICLDACHVFERLGSPEGELAIAQALVYLACASKSNAVYMATTAAREFVANNASEEVPMHLRNAPTTLMKNLAYGESYHYAHDQELGFVPGERYLPEKAKDFQCYFPVERGLEVKIKEKLLYYQQLNEQSQWKRYEGSSE